MGLMGLLHGPGQQQRLQVAPPANQQPLQVRAAPQQQLGNNVAMARPMVPNGLHVNQANPNNFRQASPVIAPQPQRNATVQQFNRQDGNNQVQSPGTPGIAQLQQQRHYNQQMPNQAGVTSYYLRQPQLGTMRPHLQAFNPDSLGLNNWQANFHEPGAPAPKNGKAPPFRPVAQGSTQHLGSSEKLLPRHQNPNLLQRITGVL